MTKKRGAIIDAELDTGIAGAVNGTETPFTDSVVGDTPTVDMPVKEEKTGPGETIRADVLGDEFLNDFIGKKTAASDVPSDKEATLTGNVDELSDQIRSEEAKYVANFTAEDFADIAEVIIDLLETVIVSGLRWWAKDDTDAPYEISEKKRKRLVKHLTMVLVKHKIHFGVEIVFALTIIMAFATPTKKAIEHRKFIDNKNAKNDTSTAEKKPDTGAIG